MGIRNLLFNKFKFSLKNTPDPRIIEKEEEVREKIDKAHAQGRYSFFENDFAYEFLDKCVKENDYDRYMVFYDMIDGWDRECNLSLETGQYIGNLWLSDPNKIPAIHRTYLDGYTYQNGMPYSEDLFNIMEEGLYNYGHANLGAVVGIPDLSLTTTPLDSFTGMINLIASYKHNNTTIIMQFPRELVDNSMGFTSKEAIDTIYDQSTGYCVIKPEYILGAVVKSDDGFDQFYSKEQILSAKVGKAM